VSPIILGRITEGCYERRRELGVNEKTGRIGTIPYRHKRACVRCRKNLLAGPGQSTGGYCPDHATNNSPVTEGEALAAALEIFDHATVDFSPTESRPALEPGEGTVSGSGTPAGPCTSFGPGCTRPAPARARAAAVGRSAATAPASTPSVRSADHE
jgi:hypothetical protein